MSLRPRYSLLTLLLLTAAVAGGIKYWRGPHWAELVEPPLQAEQAFFEQHQSLRDFIWNYSATVIRYQFVRDGLESTWLLIEGREFQRPVLITAPPRRLESGYPWSMPLKSGWQPIVYWIADVAAKPDEDSLYLLAEDQTIFRMLLLPELKLIPVSLSEIDNPAVRDRLKDELAKLHVKPPAGAASP